jgi:predicted MPP superfamily phosphohydrolase
VALLALFVMLGFVGLLAGSVLAIRAARRRAWPGLVFSLLLVIAALVFLLGLSTSRSLAVQPLSLSLAGGGGGQHMRVAFCADLHLGLYKGSEWSEKMAQIIQQAAPDLLLFGGDFTYRTSPQELAPLLHPFASVKPLLGTYAVLGNHDYGFPGLDVSETLIRVLVEDGVKVLQNEQVNLPGGLVLVGLDDLWAGRTQSRLVEGAIQNRTGPVLVFSHNPDMLKAHPPVGPGEQIVSEDRPRLLWLFGHTHGGQVRLPLIGPLFLSTDLRYDRGLFDTPWGRIFVTQGAGEVGLPVRLLTRPEVILLDLSY